MDISVIIKFINDYLTKSGLQSVSAVEANALLEKAKLLRDSKDRPGKPIRDLLRKGLIPHAYQLANSRWVIPRLNNSIPKVEKAVTLERPSSAIKTTNTHEVDALISKLNKARLAYKPHDIRYLLIAEAPPNDVERFFYYPDVKSHDHLFLGVIETLYPKLKEEYLLSGRKTDLKKKILEKIKADGFYLIDLAELPLSLKPLSRNYVVHLVNRTRQLLNDGTKVILIKSNVYKLCYPGLYSAFGDAAVNVKIPFPSTGHQIGFHAAFTSALRLAGLGIKDTK
jgi:hypothetical protein